jgi:hypothetical protein
MSICFLFLLISGLLLPAESTSSTRDVLTFHTYCVNALVTRRGSNRTERAREGYRIDGACGVGYEGCVAERKSSILAEVCAPAPTRA